MDRIRVRIQRTVQIDEFEPVQYESEYMTELRENETVADAHDRARTELARSFNPLDQDILTQLGRQEEAVPLSEPVKRPPKHRK